jgi:hypothetical protein
MTDFLFVIKALLFTFILVFLMQIPVGQITLEERSMLFIQTSGLTQPLREASHGATKLIARAWKSSTVLINSKYRKMVGDENRPGSRLESLKLSRSPMVTKKESEEPED